MTSIDDKIIDQLLMDRAADKSRMDEASKAVIKRVSKQMYRQKIRKWLQVIIYALIVPIALVIYCFALINLFAQLPTPIKWFCVCLPMATTITLWGNKILNLHIDMN